MLKCFVSFSKRTIDGYGFLFPRCQFATFSLPSRSSVRILSTTDSRNTAPRSSSHGRSCGLARLHGGEPAAHVSRSLSAEFSAPTRFKSPFSPTRNNARQVSIHLDLSRRPHRCLCLMTVSVFALVNLRNTDIDCFCKRFHGG